jgi:hypothetical protein
MANKKKALNSDVRREIATNLAKAIRRQHPEWTMQQVNDVAYKTADLQIKRGEVRVS